MQNVPRWGQDPLVQTRKRDKLISAIFEKYEHENGPLDQIKHQVQLTTFGGTGSTALSNYLRLHGVDLPNTPGEAPFKHQRIPPAPADVPSGFKVIYLYSDPRNAMLSIFRRGAICEHYHGLFGHKPNEETAARIATLQAFLQGKRDEFELMKHVKNWMQPGKGYPVLLVNFDSLPEVWETVLGFLQLPPSTPCMSILRRNCSWQRLPAEPRQAICEIYAPVVERLTTIPDVMLVD